MFQTDDNTDTQTLRVQWTMTPRTEPHPWLACSRCRGRRGFRSSGRIRVNANGRRIDAWLVYRCTQCDATWNRPIVERRDVARLDRAFLLSLQANDPDLVRALAFDVASLKRWTDRVQESDEVLVSRRVLGKGLGPTFRWLEIECRVPHPVALRVDRLLARELSMSRSALQRLAKAGTLRSVPAALDLRRPPRDGMRIVVPLFDADLAGLGDGAEVGALRRDEGERLGGRREPR